MLHRSPHHGRVYGGGGRHSLPHLSHLRLPTKARKPVHFFQSDQRQGRRSSLGLLSKGRKHADGALITTPDVASAQEQWAEEKDVTGYTKYDPNVELVGY